MKEASTVSKLQVSLLDAPCSIVDTASRVDVRHEEDRLE